VGVIISAAKMKFGDDVVWSISHSVISCVSYWRYKEFYEQNLLHVVNYLRKCQILSSSFSL